MDDVDARLSRVELATRLNADSIRGLQSQLEVVSQQVQQLVQIRADEQARAARNAARLAELPWRGYTSESDEFNQSAALATTSVVDRVFAARVRG